MILVVFENQLALLTIQSIRENGLTQTLLTVSFVFLEVLSDRLLTKYI